MPNSGRLGKDTNPPRGDRLLYNKEEAAALLSMSLSSVEYYTAAGLLRTVRKGTSVRIHRSELVRFARLNHPDPFGRGLDSKLSHHHHNNPPLPQRLLYDVKAASVLLTLSVRSLKYYVAAGSLEIVRKGTSVRIRHSELVRFSRTNHPLPVSHGKTCKRSKHHQSQ